MLGTIERMELIIPEITDTIRKALEEKGGLAEPEPPDAGEVAELVACLHRLARADWLSDETADILTRAADLLEHLVAEPEGPSDDELLKLTENISTEYLCKHKSLPSDWDPGDYASNTKGLIEFARAVLARWGRSTTQPEPMTPTDEELTLVYAYAVTAAVDNKRGPFKPEDAEAAQLAGLRAVLARWGNQS
jgi:hypothetical protein